MLRSLNFTRYFAASGRKSKTAGESISAVGRFINSEGRSAELDVKLVEEETDRILNNFEKELSKLRIGKASPSMLDSIKIDLSSYVAPLTSLATISVLDTQKLTVAPYDSTHAKSVISAINSANLNLNAVAEGSNRIVVTVPKATKDLREAVVKQLSVIAEGTKKRVREVRQTALDDCKAHVKDNDVRRQNERELQAALEKISARIEKILTLKQKEVLNV